MATPIFIPTYNIFAVPLEMLPILLIFIVPFICMTIIEVFIMGFDYIFNNIHEKCKDIISGVLLLSTAWFLLGILILFIVAVCTLQSL